MPFKGFLGPSLKMVIPTRILRRRNVYYHRMNEYSRGKVDYLRIFKDFDTRLTNMAIPYIC